MEATSVGEPVHPPSSTLSVTPSRAVPVSVGRAVFWTSAATVTGPSGNVRVS